MYLLALEPVAETLGDSHSYGFRTGRSTGTPQGGIISPTLANMTLDGLEQLLKVAFRRRREGGRQYQCKVNLVRYADDFIITGPTRDVLENEVRPLIEQFLRDRGLQLSPEKTCITYVDFRHF